MKYLGTLNEQRMVAWLVIALSLLAAAALPLSSQLALDLAKFLPLHIAMESFSVAVAMLIFSIGINIHQKTSIVNLVLLSCAFLAVGLLGFGHILSQEGMPDFVTPAGDAKAFYFTLAARLVGALALLALALLSWQWEKATRWLQAVFLASALALVVLVYWLILLHPNSLPQVFDPVTGPTAFKRGMDYLVVAINAVSALIFYRRKQAPQAYDASLLFAATTVAGLSGLFFAGYSGDADLPTLLAHVYMVVAFYLLYRAVFAFSVRRPYRLLAASEQRLRASEERLTRILEGSADGFWDCDLTTGAVEYSGRWAEMLGYAPDEVAPQRDAWESRIHPDDRERVLQNHADYLAGLSRHYEAEFRMRAKSGEWRWIRSRGKVMERDGEGKPLRISGAHSDITERKGIEENFVLLKRQSDLILNSAGEGICGVDTRGIIVFANPVAARLLGYGVMELYGQPLHDLSHHTRPDGRPYLAEDCPILASLGNGMTCREGNDFYWRKDGSSFPVEYTSTPIIEEGGEAIGAVVMFSDITERKRIEASLQESEALFRTLFEGISDAIFVLPISDEGVPGHFVVVNNVACEWLGYSHGEMLTMSPRDINAPDSGIDSTPFVKRMAAGESVTFEQVHIARNGKRIPVEITSKPFLLQGKKAVISLVRNITERKQAEQALRESEERYRNTFEQAAVGIAHMAPDGAFLRGNLKFCEIVGYACAELLRMNEREITFSDDLESSDDFMRRMMAGEIASFTMEKRFVRRDQTLVWVNLTVSLVSGSDGAPSYTVGVIEDITLRKNTEQQLRELSTHLQTVREEEKASIAREIHDDLGGTLTALKMEAYWLARKLPAETAPAPLQEHVESISGLLDSAVSVTRRIITELRPTILDDLGLLAALEWQCSQFHKRSGIECSIVRSDGGDDESALNRIQSINLFRIFQESLTNVIRHSGASRVEVEFMHEGPAVVLSISDNGRGLPQGRSVSPTSFGMRGMAERVEQLGGNIKFVTPPGGGLSVKVKLPLHAEQQEEGKA